VAISGASEAKKSRVRRSDSERSEPTGNGAATKSVTPAAASRRKPNPGDQSTRVPMALAPLQCINIEPIV